nr:MAG TPA: hypothetical protein [Caudoviricetes sp.]
MEMDKKRGKKYIRNQFKEHIIIFPLILGI